MSVGPWQIAIIALVVLMLFGASRLGDIGKGLGEGIRNFKKGISEDDPDEAPDDRQGAEPGKKQLPDAKVARSDEASAKKDA